MHKASPDLAELRGGDEITSLQLSKGNMFHFFFIIGECIIPFGDRGRETLG